MITVIEDDEDIRNSIKDILLFEGYQVQTAGNGMEGLGLLCNDAPPCLILLDLMMPVMNGWDFISACRESTSLVNIPIVVVTAAGDVRKLMGTRGVVRKPIDVERLLKIVEAYCDTSGF